MSLAPVDDVLSFTVYVVLGKEVATLVNGIQQRGSHAIPFNASHLASGLSLYRLQTTHFTQTKKMTLLR
jgi:hypothetical protein